MTEGVADAALFRHTGERGELAVRDGALLRVSLLPCSRYAARRCVRFSHREFAVPTVTPLRYLTCPPETGRFAA
jgi:hypothetical protein